MGGHPKAQETLLQASDAIDGILNFWVRGSYLRLLFQQFSLITKSRHTGGQWMTVKGRRELKIFWFCICNVPEPHNHEVLINCLGFNPQHRCDFLLGTSAHNSPLDLTLCLETLGLNNRKLHILFGILNNYRAPGMGPRINHTFKCEVGKSVINDWGKIPRAAGTFQEW